MTNGGSLEIERVLPAPPHEVFAAWTDPDAVRDWMSPSGHAEAELDVREGGRFTIVMVGEGMRIEHTGEYLVVDPPRRLTFTWVSEYTGEGGSLVSVTLAPHDDGTLLHLVHERLPEDHVSGHEGGWGTMLDRLAARIRYEGERNS